MKNECAMQCNWMRFLLVVRGTVSEDLNGWPEALTVGLAV